jgi:hypothetical protein
LCPYARSSQAALSLRALGRALAALLPGDPDMVAEIVAAVGAERR